MAFPYLSDFVNAVFGTQWRLPLPTFGLLVLAAILLSARLARLEAARKESAGILPPHSRAIVGDLAVVSALAGLLGARLFHILDHWAQFVADPAAMLLSRGGFSIYGGVCFGVVAGMIFLWRRRIPIPPMLDVVAPAMMFGYAIGRIGCQLAGDGDWGVAADLASKPQWLPDWLWAQTYDGNILGVAIAPPGVYPTPIYESVIALAAFGALWIMRSHAHRAGYLFSVYLLLAGFERLLIEKIRINVDHSVLGATLTQAEAISLVVICAGLAGVLITLRGRRVVAKAALALGVVAALSACAPF